MQVITRLASSSVRRSRNKRITRLMFHELILIVCDDSVINFLIFRRPVFGLSPWRPVRFLYYLKFDIWSLIFLDFWTNGRHWRTLPPSCVVLTNMVDSRQFCRKGGQSETSFVEWAAKLPLSLSTGGWLSQCVGRVPNSLFARADTSLMMGRWRWRWLEQYRRIWAI